MYKLQSIYYQPSPLWKGWKAIKKLRELSKEKPNIVQQWLARQVFWQVHSPPLKCIDRPHYEVAIPNEMHQFDLLYMPTDTLHGNECNYILSRNDIASRYKVAKLMKMKHVKGVAYMITDIYKICPPTYPKVFQCDNGSKFKAEVTKMLEKHGVMTKYQHTHKAFIKALNKLLIEQLFKLQVVQKSNDLEKVSSVWLKQLYRLVDQLNDLKTYM